MSAFAFNTPLASTVEFRQESDNALIDPTTVTFFMRRPGSAVVEEFVYDGDNVPVERVSLGIYKYAWTANLSGWWIVSWRGEGGVFHAVTPDEKIYIRAGIQG